MVLTGYLGSTDTVIRADWHHTAGIWKTDTARPRAERQSCDALGSRRAASDWTALRAAHAVPPERPKWVGFRP